MDYKLNKVAKKKGDKIQTIKKHGDSVYRLSLKFRNTDKESKIIDSLNISNNQTVRDFCLRLI
ncbi:MAG: hypothetical protein E6176_06720, partial [Clostridium celatum]|nr:hypothetical protein [Clostridium celatum]